ncbi:dienelactone hydrolase family protein [Hydrogenophaga laconesensis]|uniref:Carboxymethylenebutenolidase n=1 Tax=Hydrogenophaga laconesensis TaxID=1805971 RepID=A0ABU1V8F6_9BURK|nr:dienelactone hydrolase family protein [Hydrogenophaga laconesensis]MDR7093508.1 carboxymethylenebutenolidase [Hydrogenophaga laconesensis]
MKENWFDIATPDGTMNTFAACPDEGGPFPAVLFYMDAFGLREEIYAMVRRLASAGYFVVAPNLYYRRTPEFSTDQTPAGMARLFEMMSHLTNTGVTADTGALLAWLPSQAEVRHARVGAVGYCMSGPFVIAAAAAFPDQVACVASIHGAHLVTDRPDSPHLLARRLRSEVYLGCATNDKWAEPRVIAQLEAALQQSGTAHRVEWYGGAQHGFVFPQRTGVYDRPAAERHWSRLHALFDRHLLRA